MNKDHAPLTRASLHELAAPVPAFVRVLYARPRREFPGESEGVKVYEYRFPDGAFVQVTSERSLARAIQKDSCVAGGNKIVAERRRRYRDEEIDILIIDEFEKGAQGRAKAFKLRRQRISELKARGVRVLNRKSPGRPRKKK